MDLGPIVTAVLFANGLTLAIFYSLWRIKRNEGDMKAIALFLFCLLVVGIMAWPAGRTEAPTIAPHSSAAQDEPPT